MQRSKSRLLFPALLLVALPSVSATSCGGLNGGENTGGGGSSAGGSGGYGIGGYYCFAEGTLVDTPFGSRPIEGLRPSDLVLTYDTGHHGVDGVRPGRRCRAPRRSRP